MKARLRADQVVEVPHRVVNAATQTSDKGITSGALLTMVVLIRIAKDEGKTTIKPRTLAEYGRIVGVSADQVRRNLRQLERANLLRRIYSRGRNGPSAIDIGPAFVPLPPRS